MSPRTPRDVEEAYDRFLDREIDREYSHDDDDDDREEEPDYGSLVDDAVAGAASALAFVPAWCLFGVALHLLGV